MTMGWNIGLAELTNSKINNTTEGEKGQVDFSFLKKTPPTQDNVKTIRFGDEVIKMVKGGILEEPMALLFKWEHYLTTEGCLVRWKEKVTAKYIKNKGYSIGLGNDCVMNEQMSVHCLNRISRKMAINIFKYI